jgi:hypothetical protein
MRTSSTMAPMAGAVETVHEGLRVGPGLHAQAHGADQQRQAVAHGRVVVDQMDQR